jgi:hypothetical protein
MLNIKHQVASAPPRTYTAHRTVMRQTKTCSKCHTIHYYDTGTQNQLVKCHNQVYETNALYSGGSKLKIWPQAGRPD